MRRSCRDNRCRVDTRSELGNLLDQCVGEDVLRNGDGNGAAKRVEEYCYSVASWHVLLVEHDLHRDKGDLHTGAGANAGEDLEADPCGGAAVDLEGVEHAAADGEDCAAGPGEGNVGAEGGDAAAYDDAGESDADKVGDCADAGAFGGGAFDGLEVEGEVKDVGVESHAEEGGEQGAGEYCSLTEDDARWESGAVTEVEL